MWVSPIECAQAAHESNEEVETHAAAARRIAASVSHTVVMDSSPPLHAKGAWKSWGDWLGTRRNLRALRN
jgi:hypothetical protein